MPCACIASPYLGVSESSGSSGARRVPVWVYVCVHVRVPTHVPPFNLPLSEESLKRHEAMETISKT